MSKMKDEDFNALKKLLEHIRSETGSEAKTEKQREKPLYKNEYPFPFHDKFLEYIGFAAGSFSIFLEFNPFASKKEEEFLFSQFVLSCIARCAGDPRTCEITDSGYTYITNALKYCCSSPDDL